MPFTSEQFFQVFEKYNQAIFPMQFALVWAAAAAVILAIRRRAFSDQIIAGLLAFLWLWTGVVYHLIFFAEINPAANLFGVVFIVQGLLFFHQGVLKERLSFRFESDFFGILGAILTVYALVFYPVAGAAMGRYFPAAPTFGAPCPMVIFTFGLLLWTNKNLAPSLLIIPILWGIVGSSAAVAFGVKEDFGLSLAGIAGLIFIIRRDFSPRKELLQ